MLVETLYGEEGFHFGPMQRGIVRASAVEGCPRRVAYTYLGYEQNDGPPLNRVKAEDGNLHERDMTNRLLERGYRIWNFGDKQTMTHYRSPSVHYTGHVDSFIEIEGVNYLLELKAFRSEIFETYIRGAHEVDQGIFLITDIDRMKKKPWPIMGQVQIYLHSEAAESFGVEEVLVVIKNKNTAELAECIVPKDPEYVEGLDKKWVGFWSQVDAGILPKRAFSDDSKECEYCPFYEMCWKKPLSVLSSQIKKHVDLSQASEDRRKGTQLKSLSEFLLQEARNSFMEAMLEHDTCIIESNSLTATASQRSRSGYSESLVEGLLNRLLKEEAITQEEIDAVRYSTSYTEVRFKDRS